MEKQQFVIGENVLSIEGLAQLMSSDHALVLSPTVQKAVLDCRTYLDEKMERETGPVYGINTGFGSLCNTRIQEEDLSQLQHNLVMSHACGMGDRVPDAIVELMLLLKVQGLSYGHSGVALSTIKQLVALYNNGVYPHIFEQGSLGASGDLAPLAHLSLTLIGMGKVQHGGNEKTSEATLKALALEPLTLQSKEGLALLNGTQFMSAYGVWCLVQMRQLMDWADVTAAISLEAYDGRLNPFSVNVHAVRPHKGQGEVAARMRQLLEGSELIAMHKEHVQDPYSFRCVPQVHGASRDAVRYIQSVVETEINSVTDNPTIFPETDEIISAGNFHGQPLALALDHLAIAAAELASISERRVYKLISGTRGLPPFLVSNPGLNSGFMIPQYSAASIVSQNKQLATPASVDSIESSNGQEDHVSMGANAATKAYRVVQNLEKVLAIELFNAVQALEFRRPAKSSPYLERIVSAYRKEVPFVEDDTIMHDRMQASVQFLRNFQLDKL